MKKILLNEIPHNIITFDNNELICESKEEPLYDIYF